MSRIFYHYIRVGFYIAPRLWGFGIHIAFEYGFNIKMQILCFILSITF